MRARSLRRVRARPLPTKAPGTSNPLLGPHHAQVVKFLAALRTLSAEEWQRILARAERGSGARALDAVGRDAERMEAMSELSKSLGVTTAADKLTQADLQYAAAFDAIETLVVQDLLPPKQFAALYSAFEPFIPIRSLGPVRAKPLPPL